MTASTMSTLDPKTMTNTVTAVFDGPGRAEAALQALRDAGFLTEQISLVTKNVGVPPEEDAAIQDAGIGAGSIGVLGGLAGWLLGISALAIPVVGELVRIGILWATLAGTGIGIAAGGSAGR